MKKNPTKCAIHSHLDQKMYTVSSSITDVNPLCLQLIGVSDPTLPEIVTIKGSTLLSMSSILAEMLKKTQQQAQKLIAKKKKMQTNTATYQKHFSNLSTIIARESTSRNYKK